VAKTFTNFWNELKGDVPALSPFKAQDLVQRAWREVRDSRRWSFLVDSGVIYTPASVTAGTVAVSQFSASVVGNAAAKAVWDTLILHASGIDITKRQFRVSTTPIYNINAYDPATITLTLDRMYMEASAPASSYEMLRCYVESPTSDFLRWESLVDPVNQFRFRKKNLHRFRTELDRIDPRRSASGTPYMMASYKAKSDGTPMWEMYPAPTSEITYVASYSRRGTDLAAGDTLPAVIPDELLMSRARFLLYVWCGANESRFAELQGTDWLRLRREEDATYKALLTRAKSNDDELWPANWSESEEDGQYLGVLDANWLQQHDLVLT